MKLLIFFTTITILFLSTRSAFAQRYCFNYAAQRFDVKPNLLYAIAKVESGFNPYAIDYDNNGTYDYGVMQINTVWYKELGLTQWKKLKHACFNIQVGAWILGQCQNRYHNVLKAIACYHSGTGNINGNKQYINNVVAVLRRKN
jgi:soluble lytic murein transglycosylase-like protein